LRAAGCGARIVTLPPGDDPDSYVRVHGAQAFRGLLDNAVPGIQFQLDRHIEAIKTGFAGRAEVARRAEALTLETVPSEERDRWRVYVAGRLDISVDDLRKSRLLTNPMHFSPRAPGGERAPLRAGRHVIPGSVDPPSFEREVIAIMLEEPLLLDEYADLIRPERFEHRLFGRVYAALIDRRKELLQPSDVRVLFSGDDEASGVLDAVLGAERSATVCFAGSDARRAFLDRVIARFHAADLQREYRELDARMNRLVETGELVSQDLRDRHRALAAKLKG
jgi:DNA primase